MQHCSFDQKGRDERMESMENAVTIRSLESRFTDPPFPASVQLCSELEFTAEELQHCNKVSNRPSLPGQPQLELCSHIRVLDFCAKEVRTQFFDSVVTSRYSLRLANEPQKALSELGALRRNITLTEDPRLHCVWDEDRIFIKPIPIYLTSHAFWRFLLSHCDYSEQQELVSTALGYLRSYSRLIVHASDYEIARKHHLIPMTWSFDQLVIFLSYFACIPDSAVSPRYRLGEMQLQTLNWFSFFRSGTPYYRVHRHRYNSYFSQFYGPTLFVFASFSVVLSAMQVSLAVRQGMAPIEEMQNMTSAGGGGGLGGDWLYMGRAYNWFSIYSICFSAGMGAFLLSLFFGLVSLDAIEDFRDRVALKRARGKDG
jgi:hypothetical protein